jgi:hypothetical protein
VRQLLAFEEHILLVPLLLQSTGLLCGKLKAIEVVLLAVAELNVLETGERVGNSTVVVLGDNAI